MNYLYLHHKLRIESQSAALRHDRAFDRIVDAKQVRGPGGVGRGGEYL